MLKDIPQLTGTTVAVEIHKGQFVTAPFTLETAWYAFGRSRVIDLIHRALFGALHISHSAALRRLGRLEPLAMKFGLMDTLGMAKMASCHLAKLPHK